MAGLAAGVARMGTVGNRDTLVGVRLGSCVLQRPLGEGGMGAVYLAQQERPRRQVAVKVLRPQLSANARAWPIFLARFRREADATAALDHGNIVPIYEFGEQDGTAYLVMPYLPDGSLAQLLEREGGLPLERTLDYLTQAAAALDYAHRHGIVHRDVKPSNLLLHPDGRLLLADFGIARPLDRRELPPLPAGAYGEDEDESPTLTRDGAVMGTPQYMSPEQIRGEQATPASDVYALAALAYTMLAGEPPFGEGAPGEILRRQLLGRPVPLRSLRPDLPPSVERAIARTLDPDPARRPPTAGAFVQALHGTGRPRTLGEATTIGAAPQRARASGGIGTARLSSGGAFGPTHEAPTIYDGAFAPATSQPGAAPEWPGAGDGGERFGGPPGDEWLDRPRRPRRGLVFAGIAGAVLVVLLFAGLLNALAHLNGGAPTTGAGGSPHATELPTATATPKPTATPTATPVVNWLSVSPASVNLGCSKADKSAKVVLTNLGPDRVSWTANAPFFGGVSVSPSSGRLSHGQHVTITITNTSFWTGHNDVISFTPDDSEAGAPAAVSYTSPACG